jgi:hypothetical protein
MADGDSTIEGALEVTRNLHRLILSVSVITIVFAFSLRKPENEVTQHKAIESFLAFDFSAYDTFVQDKIDAFAEERIAPAAAVLSERVDDTDFPILDIHEIADEFERPIVFGRFLVKDSKLSTPADLTLRQLKSFSDLFPLAIDVRVAVPDTASAVEPIVEFLQSSTQGASRIDSATLEQTKVYIDTDPPSASEQIPISLYFVLQGDNPSSPVFTKEFRAAIAEVPDTSFRSWLETQDAASKFVTVQDETLIWLPPLESLNRELAERRLGDVQGYLSDALSKGSPENRTISLLGVDIPGNLLIFATPLLLVALLYHLLFHLRHLVRFSAEHRGIVERFAWLPISHGAGWFADSLVSIALLPIVAALALGIQLFRFGLIEWASGLYILAGVAVSLWLAVRSIHYVAVIRMQIGRSFVVGWRITPKGRPKA